jgi:hypothetical protein
MRVLRIDVDGTLSIYDRTFEEIKDDMNNAHIEGIMLEDCMLFVDEDGQARELPANPVATYLAFTLLVGIVYAVSPDDKLPIDPAAIHRIELLRDDLKAGGDL